MPCGISYHIKLEMTDHWVADLNTLLYSNDKQGGHLIGNASDKAFCEFVKIIGGIDIDSKGQRHG